MIEARRGQIVIIKNPKFSEMEGVIEALEDDRIKIYYPREYESSAWALSEGDELLVTVHTSFGVRHMNSMVISSPSADGELVIENAAAFELPKNREYVRAAVEFSFFVKKDDSLIRANCIDISAGGIKFAPEENILAQGDEIEIKFLSEEFEKDINLKALVLNVKNSFAVACYSDVNEFDRDKIAKFCIKVLDERD